MSMPILASNPVREPNILNTDATQSGGKLSGKFATQAEAHAQLNAAIINTSIEVSINTKNEPLALLLKSAITGINEALKPAFGENAIQTAVSQDNTPEGTAGRIVSLSTGFFEAFKKQHVGEADADVLNKFMTTIRGGFEQGYKEARDILQGMGALNGDIAGNIDKTYQLVQKGYEDFVVAHTGGQPVLPENSQTNAIPQVAA